MAEFSEYRREYLSDILDIDMLCNDPMEQFNQWLQEALKANVPDATAMVLSTSTAEGRPSSRVVLLKEVAPDGFVFFTNYNSRKGIEISNNPYGALLFFWPALERQIRIEGRIIFIQSRQSDEYYLSRPEGGKIGAWASPQSQQIPNREYLEKLQEDYTRLFQTRDLTRPLNWGGYKLMPSLYEFWQGRENRLHDRFEYIKKGPIWEINRLAP